MDAVKIGKKLKSMRIANGETLENASNLLKISTSALGMYETGRRIPRDSVKIRIAQHYKRTVEDIFFAE